MRLLEAILRANHAAPPGATPVELADVDTAAGLPLVVLTCIDPRLNALLPHRLGVPEEQFIWLRNAGNIITGPLSSTLRSIALACAIKGGKEFAVIGHTDCLVCKTTVLSLTEAFRRLGVDRQRLPENLVEYFGLFASERQNVMRGAEIVRGSPLIGAGVPVHGLLMDLANGRLEWVVNGYEVHAGAPSVVPSAVEDTTRAGAAIGTTMDRIRTPEISLRDMKLPELNLGGVKFPKIEVSGVKLPAVEVSGFKLPEIKIGGHTLDPNRWLSQVKAAHQGEGSGGEGEGQGQKEGPVASRGEAPPEETFDKTRKYRVIGSDQKVYGPINGFKILQWIGEGRIGWDTPSQVEGSGEWRPLSLWSEALKKVLKPRPPRLPG